MTKAAAQMRAAAPEAAAIAPLLLAWYDRHRRSLPWRSAPGQPSDPYAVWLSEIMLQQTTVAAVKPYYAAFLAAWPRVEDLAAASLEDVLAAWAGLGYYSRARNLHACARLVATEQGGRFPDDLAGLRKLPGIGAYTAAAIAAIAFGQRAVVVDGNVERVMARVFAIEQPLPEARPALRDAMESVTPQHRVGDFAQATMDLGATICTPRRPACILCPLSAPCAARRLGTVTELPRKRPKEAVPVRKGQVFMIARADGALLVRRRPPQGLFGGMLEFPSTPWTAMAEPSTPSQTTGLEGLHGPAIHVGDVEHGLTHFTLRLAIHAAEAVTGLGDDHLWVPADPSGLAGMPTLMHKVLAAYLDGRPAKPDSNDALALPVSPRRRDEPARDGFQTRRRRRTGTPPAGPSA